MILKRSIRGYLVLLVFFLLFTVWGSPSGAAQDDKNNILILWTEKDRLKAVTLLAVQDYDRPVGIVAIPVFIRLSEGEQHFTISDTYTRLGREGLTYRLEQLFQTHIDSYLAVDQSTLDKASCILGPIVMEGRTTSLAEVFEGSYTDGEIEPQSEIRSLAASLVEPRILPKAPQVVLILTKEVRTNLRYRSIWNIYRMVEVQGPGVIHKRAVTGNDFYVGNRKYRDVAPEAWGRVFSDVTRT
jgi:anionic cell wall polymer biosynthesis LytR-Cps2A-Psr (LCP) family protein